MADEQQDKRDQEPPESSSEDGGADSSPTHSAASRAPQVPEVDPESEGTLVDPDSQLARSRFEEAAAAAEEEDFECTLLADGTAPPRMETTPPVGSGATPPPITDATPTEVLGEAETEEWPEIPDVELEQEIGRGGMGVVYSGRQTYLDRKVAVKLLAITDRGPTFAARFQREAKILASLSHPHVVSCYQAGTLPDGKCFLVMEFIDGPNLLEWIREHGPLTVKHALTVCRDVALALECAYEKTIIHRDVKPANVLMQRDASEDPTFPFKSKLADLGLARGTGEDSTMMELTMRGAVMGSPPTMAPEQFDDPDQVDFRADIYGLGCTLFHMLTGKLAFPQRTLTATISRKMSDDAPDPSELQSDLHPGVAELVRSMLARAPEDRPQSYCDLVDRCNLLVDELSRLPVPVPVSEAPAEAPQAVAPVDKPEAVKSGGGALLWSGALVALLAVAGLYFGLSGGDDGEPRRERPRDLDGATELARREPDDGPPVVPEPLIVTPAGGASGSDGAGIEAPPGAGVLDGDTTRSGAEPEAGKAPGGPEEGGSPPADDTQAPVRTGRTGAKGGGAPLGNAEPDLAGVLPGLDEGDELVLFTSDPDAPLVETWAPDDPESWILQGPSVTCFAHREPHGAVHPVPAGIWSLEGGIWTVMPGRILDGGSNRVLLEFEGDRGMAIDLWTEEGLVKARAQGVRREGAEWALDANEQPCFMEPLSWPDVQASMREEGDVFARFKLTWDNGFLGVELTRARDQEFQRTGIDLEAGERPRRIVLSASGCKAQYESFVFRGIR